MAAANSQNDLHKIYDGVTCPRCSPGQRSTVQTTIFGKGAFIRACSACGWCVGVDDSANICDLGAGRWTFYIPVADSAQGYSCLKGKTHDPRFVNADAERLMQAICVNCLKTGIMYSSADVETVYARDKETPVFDVDEILRVILANVTQQESSPELDNAFSEAVQAEIESFQDKTSDEFIAKLPSVDDVEDSAEALLACKCGRKECSKCRSGFFSATSVSEKPELKNRKVESEPDSVEKTAAVKDHVRVTDLSQLRPGDHIAWDRVYAVWHHAIVVQVEKDAQEIVVLHNSGGRRDNVNGRLASVREEPIKVDCATDFLYVYRYSDEECYPPGEVIDRAIECLGESYNPFKYNCEHFARWCKAGLKCCLQIEGFFHRLITGASSSCVKFLEDCMMVALRLLANKETMGQILATGAKGARQAIKAQLGESTKLFRYAGRGTLTCSIVLCVATEVIFFIYKVYKVDRKDTPWDEFQRYIVELIFEGLFGLGAGFTCGYLVSLIPVAGVFLSPLGYIIGNLIGRLLGTMAGGMIARRLPNMKQVTSS